MPFNGSGVYTAPSLPGSFNPAISGQDATPDDWNTLLDDIEVALSTCWTTDGQSTITANQPMSGFKFTGVGDATARTQFPSMGQIQDGKGVSGTVGGTADAITLTTVPVIAAYVLNQVFRLIAAGPNTIPGVTLNVDGVGAGPVVWPNGVALVANDIVANEGFTVMVADISTPTAPVFHLQTAKQPTTINQSTTGPTVQKLTSGTAATYTTAAGAKWIKVRIQAGGGGGGGVGTVTGPTGATGGTTSFNSITALGGVGGGGQIGGASAGANPGGAGGTGGSGTAVRSPGNGGSSAAALANGYAGGIGGGGGIFGGGAAAIVNSGAANGTAGAANSGGGGSGAISPGNTFPAAGGGGGEGAEFIIINPSATYTYTIGAGGAGALGTGTGPAQGGAGGTGYIVVEEHYNY